MAVKTITIDMAAYGLLSRHKQAGQSFSDVIKAHFGNDPTVGGFRAVLRTVRLSEATLNLAERRIRARQKSPARAVRR